MGAAVMSEQSNKKPETTERQYRGSQMRVPAENRQYHNGSPDLERLKEAVAKKGWKVTVREKK